MENAENDDDGNDECDNSEDDGDDDGNDEENSPSDFPMMNKPPESSTSNAKFSEHATLTIFGFLEAPPINVSMRMGNISASRFSEGDALFSASSLFLL